MDAPNHYLLSLPTKLLLWNWRALDHRLPEESEAALSRYLRVNRLSSVKVRHNQYAPLGEFRALIRNRNTGAGYRYSLGLLLWLQYTLLPGRLLAGLPVVGIGDHFNPFSNTIHVYSSDATILLHEAGHAKDYAGRRARGTEMALARLVPGVDLIQEATASSDAIHFLQCAGEPALELRAYRSLWPAYSTYIASYLPGGVLVFAPVVLGGHITGRVRAHLRARELSEDLSVESSCKLPE